MPCYLSNINVIPELAGFKSVLIVPCRFCPAASMAVSRNEPYIEFFKRLLKTASYEDYIKTIQANLQEQGIRTDVFRSRLLHQFVLCLWTSKRRKKLLECARQYEALLVLGCEVAVKAVRDSVQPASCQVVEGMKTEGLMSVKPGFQLPCNISLELDSIIPIQSDEGTNPDSYSVQS